MDNTLDNNSGPVQLLRKHNLIPDYVNEKESTESLINNAFADTVNRRFPLHTKSASYLSVLYARLHPDIDSQPFEARFKQAMTTFDIEDDVAKAEAALGEAYKKASEDTVSYGLVLKKDDAQFEIYPLHDEDLILKSANSLMLEKNEYGPEFFRSISTNIVKAANAKGVPLTDLPLEIANAGISRSVDRDALQNLITNRTETFGEDTGRIYSKVAANLLADAKQGGEIEKYAGLIQTLDNYFAVDATIGINDARSIILSGDTDNELEKKASENVDFNGKIMPKSVLTSLGDDFVESYFTPKTAGFVKTMVKLASEKEGPCFDMFKDIHPEFLDEVFNTVATYAP